MAARLTLIGESIYHDQIDYPTQCSGDLIDVLIDPGDPNDGLMYLVTKSKIKIKVRLPFWLLTKIRLSSQFLVWFIFLAPVMFAQKGIFLIDLVLNWSCAE